MTAPRTTDAVLRRAANALSAGEIPWGRNYFIGDGGCRCAAGAIAYAANPDDEDGDPMQAGPYAHAAVEILADYLVNELAVTRATFDEDWTDAIETVGDWNDQPERTVTDVIAALEAAANRIPTAVAS